MSKKKSVMGSKNELRDNHGTGPASAYKFQPVEDRKSKPKKSKRGY